MPKITLNPDASLAAGINDGITNEADRTTGLPLDTKNMSGSTFASPNSDIFTSSPKRTPQQIRSLPPAERDRVVAVRAIACLDGMHLVVVYFIDWFNCHSIRFCARICDKIARTSTTYSPHSKASVSVPPAPLPMATRQSEPKSRRKRPPSVWRHSRTLQPWRDGTVSP